MINDDFTLFSSENLKLNFNGTIYNIDDLKQDFNLNKNLSAGNVLLQVFESNLINGKLNKESITNIINILDGDFAFSISDGTNTVLARDPIGIKPLYYSNTNTSIFSSKLNINKNNIQNLKPGHILYNNNDYFIYDLFKDTKPLNNNYDDLINKIIKTLYDSVYERVKNLNNIGLLCSGGVDSAFLAYILKNISKKTKLNIKLYAVGNKNSKDLIYSKKIAQQLNLPLKIQTVTKDKIKEILPKIINATKTTNNMKLGVASTIYLATNLMKQDKQKIGLTGQGADELFAGYNRYIKHIENNTPEKLENELIHDLKNMYHVNLERDYAASAENQIKLRLPYLSNKMIKLGLKIPIKYKITNKEDKLKKHILRDAATKYGIPEEISKRPKKAAQYGSGIDKIIKKKLRKELNFEEILKK